MNIYKKFKNLSIGRQLQILFISCAVVICIVLVIITKYQLDWLRNFLTDKSESVLNHTIEKQLKALGIVQSKYFSSEIQNYMSLVSSNKRSSETFHNFTSMYPKNPFVPPTPHPHTEAVNKTYLYGVYYSRNTISTEGWSLINAESSFNYFYPLLYRTEYLGYYAGFEIDEIYHGYPGRKRARVYTPLVREWYYKGVQNNGSLTITEPYIDFTTLKFVITISRAIMTSEGKPYGVTALDVTLAQLTERTTKIKILNSGFAILVSRGGMILTVPEFWKPAGSTDVTIKMFDTKYTGLDYDQWETIKNLSIDTPYKFIDSRGKSLFMVKQLVQPYFDNDNLTHYFFLLVETDEMNIAKDYTINSFNDTYLVLFWISISFGVTVFIIICVLIYVVTRNYSKKFKMIEKIFGGIVNRALFFDTTKTVDYEDLEANEEGIESLAFHCKDKVEHIRNLENRYNKFTTPHTRPNEKFIYDNISQCMFPFNYYTEKQLPWLGLLEKIRREYE